MKKDCYFYDELSGISTCKYYCGLGYCPCIDCKKYVSESDVYELIKTIVETAERCEEESDESE